MNNICVAAQCASPLYLLYYLPLLELHSTFADIYDEDHFISSLKDYVTVVRDLPNELMESYNFSISAIPSMRVPAWASARYYMDEVYPVLQETRYCVTKVFCYCYRLHYLSRCVCIHLMLCP